MGKLILFADTTVDGFMASTSGDMDWMVQDDEMDKEMTTALRATVDTILSGRVTYQGFEEFWPAAAADPSSPPDLVELATWMLETPTIVFSSTLASVKMTNARLAEAGLAETVENLKRRDGGDVVLFGGVSTAGSLVALGLVDEYRLKVHPTAIGRGRSMFEGVEGNARLRRTWSKAYGSGAIAVTYEPAR